MQANPTAIPVAYRWVNTTTYPNQLRYYTNALDANAAGNRLASNVTSLTFQTQTKTVDSTLVVTNVSITMTIASGRDLVTLCASVAPRREMTAQ